MSVQSKAVLYNLKEGHQLGLTKSTLPYPMLARGPGKGTKTQLSFMFYLLVGTYMIKDPRSN